MKRHRNILVLLAALVTLACSNEQADSSQPLEATAKASAGIHPSVALEGRVTDSAHLLSLETRDRLTAKLARLETVTSHQMVVVTVSSLGGQDIADFTRDLSNSWGIGRKGYNDGIVLLVAPHEQKVRIAVGYGLEGVLTKAVCDQIIQTSILPRFRAGDLSGGVEDGSDALIALLT